MDANEADTQITEEFYVHLAKGVEADVHFENAAVNGSRVSSATDDDGSYVIFCENCEEAQNMEVKIKLSDIKNLRIANNSLKYKKDDKTLAFDLEPGNRALAVLRIINKGELT